MVILTLTFGGRNLYTFYISTLTFVCSYREGSVIADFIVSTAQVIPGEIAEVNQKLPEAMSLIAPVIGPVTAFYNSKFKKKVICFSYFCLT